MATTRKKLSRATAAAALVALDTLLHDTGHDDRLSGDDRVLLEAAAQTCHRLEARLRADERVGAR